jgi:hypothetical protein
MNRLRCAVVAAFLGGLIAGCGGDQPNPPAQEMTPEVGKSAADMMRKANSGMDPKKAKTANAPPKS